MPLIAIAPCRTRPDYEESIRRAGGDPQVLDRPADSPADVVRRFDAVLLTGGGDVHPSLYGEPTHPSFSAAEEGRDEYEMELVQRAMEADLPVLAICRGLQVLNVARGGTLVQDIPDQLGHEVNHRVPDPPSALAHDIEVARGSRLADLLRERLDGERCAVNSRHHQGPKQLGHGLLSTATAADGVIEAVEDPRRRFCIGVQWHPENFWRTGEFRVLFEELVRAAGSRRR